MLNPSRADLRVACPGSRSLELKSSEQDSVYKDDGKEAHDLARRMLLDLPIPPTSDEMLAAVKIYVNAIKTTPGAIAVEDVIHAANIHPLCKGVIDAYVINATELTIFEFKYGMKPVEVYENWQLLEYAAGIFDKRKELKKITLVIVQPRVYHRNGAIRRWMITAEQLSEYIKRLSAMEHVAAQDNAPCKPNPLCTKCRARSNCVALRHFTLTAIEFSQINESEELPAAAFAHELPFLKMAKDLITTRILALEEQAKATIKRGERIPGYSLRAISTRETWSRPALEIAALGVALGINLLKAAEVITPKQARTLGVPDDILSIFATQEMGALKLVENSAFAIDLVGNNG